MTYRSELSQTQQHHIHRVPPCLHVSQKLQFWNVILNLVAITILLHEQTELVAIYDNFLELGPVII